MINLTFSRRETGFVHIAVKQFTSTYNQHNNSRLYSKGEAPTLRQAYSYNKDNSTLDKT